MVRRRTLLGVLAGGSLGVAGVTQTRPFKEAYHEFREVRPALDDEYHGRWVKFDTDGFGDVENYSEPVQEFVGPAKDYLEAGESVYFAENPVHGGDLDEIAMYSEQGFDIDDPDVEKMLSDDHQQEMFSGMEDDVTASGNTGLLEWFPP